MSQRSRLNLTELSRELDRENNPAESECQGDTSPAILVNVEGGNFEHASLGPQHQITKQDGFGGSNLTGANFGTTKIRFTNNYSTIVRGATYQSTSGLQVANTERMTSQEAKDCIPLSDSIWMFRSEPICPRANVYEGEQRSEVTGSRPLAIKFLSYDEKHKREANILMKLNAHPNVVTIVYANVYDKGPLKYIYIAMERCNNQTLGEYIQKIKKREIKFDSKRVKYFAKQIITGIEFIHNNDVVHGDLKPDNVLFSCDLSCVKIIDFGLSKELRHGQSVTQQGASRLGTDGYRAPETYNSDVISKRADIFSLGLVVYNIWALCHPFGDDPDDWNRNIKKYKKLNLRGLLVENTEGARNLIQSMLQLNPENRPTATDVSKHEYFTGQTSFSRSGPNEIESLNKELSDKYDWCELNLGHPDAYQGGVRMMAGNDDVVGIHLGLTNSSVAICEHRKVIVFENDLGSRATPSYVSFTKDGILVGEEAKIHREFNLENTIYDVGRMLGRKSDDDEMKEYVKNFPFKVILSGRNPEIEINFRGKKKRLRPEEISAKVLKRMTEIAEEYLGKSVRKAVITVPAYFNSARRWATEQAASIAGLKVLIISEPTAATVACVHDRKITSGKILVFHFGRTFDVSIVQVQNGNYRVKAVARDDNLGGQDVNKIMEKHFTEKIERRYSKKITLRETVSLRKECEKAKKILSIKNKLETGISIILENGKFFDTSITRSDFEDMTRLLFQPFEDHMKSVLKDAKLGINEIDNVILWGGSTRIPCVQKIIQRFFGGKDLRTSFNPEGIAYGAAVVGAELI